MSDQVTPLVLTGAALALMAIAVSAMFDGLQSTLADFSISLGSSFDALLGSSDIGTAVGWINVEMLSITAPFALIGVAIFIGSKALAGENHDRTLAILRSVPVRRSTVVFQKMAVMIVVAAGIAVLTGVGLLLGSGIGGLGLSAANVASSMVHLFAIGVLFGAVAFKVGAACDVRTAIGVAASVVLVAFMFNWLLLISDATADWARLSPWYYYRHADPRANGADWAHVGALGALAAAVLAFAALLFDRREITL